jgi:hypothetical protein
MKSLSTGTVIVRSEVILGVVVRFVCSDEATVQSRMDERHVRTTASYSKHVEPMDNK